MARDNLALLLRIRQQSCDAAQREFARALRAQADAMQDLAKAEQTILMEENAASVITGGDDLVEAFAAWLPVARGRVMTAQRRALDADAEVARGRAVLTASRVALRTLETLAAEREDRHVRSLAHRADRDREDTYRPTNASHGFE